MAHLVATYSRLSRSGHRLHMHHSNGCQKFVTVCSKSIVAPHHKSLSRTRLWPRMVGRDM